MSKRERGKQERRQRVLAAARHIIGRTGELGLSMRMLSTESDLSAATLYNLFGSKDNIVLELFNESLTDFEQRVQDARPKNTLDRIFVSVRVACDLYASEEAFFRAFFGKLFANPAPELRSGFIRPRENFYRRLVRTARTDGWLNDGAADEDVARAIVQLFGSALVDWGKGYSDLGELERQLLLGLALILGGIVTDKGSTYVAAVLQLNSTRTMT